jgi:hypothetical protein
MQSNRRAQQLCQVRPDNSDLSQGVERVEAYPEKYAVSRISRFETEEEEAGLRGERLGGDGAEADSEELED